MEKGSRFKVAHKRDLYFGGKGSSFRFLVSGFIFLSTASYKSEHFDSVAVGQFKNFPNLGKNEIAIHCDGAVFGVRAELGEQGGDRSVTGMFVRAIIYNQFHYRFLLRFGSAGGVALPLKFEHAR